jgi:hypothetical protein
MFYTTMVLMQNPVACSLSSTMGFSILDEWESQIILEPPSLNAWEHGKFNNVGRVACGRSTFLTTTKGGQSS